MKLNHLLAAFLFTIMISCKSKTAFDYSEDIVKMETELSADIAEADQKLTEYLNAQKIDSAILMSKQMETLAESKLKEVQKMNVPEVAEGENFKRAAIRYFSFIKSIYTSFKKFNMAKTDAEKEKERKRLARIIAEKNEITEAMKKAQQRFAAANNFTVGKD